MKKKYLAVYGSGGLGMDLLDTCYKLGIAEDILFVDDKRGAEVNGIKALAFERILERRETDDIEFVVAVGEPQTRKKIHDKLASYAFPCAKIIGPSAEVSPFAVIGDGTVVQSQSIVVGGVRIGFGCWLNFRVLLGHEAVIGDYCVLSPNVNVGGNTVIGDACFLGNSAVIRDHIKIGSNAVIGMGAVVLKDVPDNAVMVGNPARQLRENSAGRVFK
jgi:sugar O-acyltransferase (sialic acid O-acetyltransferase NeuD family)